MEYFLLILYPIIGCFGLLLLRFLLVRFVFTPIGLWFGLRNCPTKKPPENLVLEREFSLTKKWDQRQIVALSKQLDISEESIKDWLRLKLAHNKTSVLTKFSESSWKLCYYTCETLFGFVVLCQKPWFWDSDEWWRDLANQTVTKDVWLYFILCTSCAWSQLIAVTIDVRRKDFLLMVAHHLAFISLMTLCGGSNIFRGVTVAAFLANSNDVFLELSKVAHYLGYAKIAVYGFLMFTVWWLIVRLAFVPFRLIKTFVVDAPRFVPGLDTLFVYYAVNTLNVIFFMINLVWTYFIIKAAIAIFIIGKPNDSRSDSD
ncbi:ceramide synthase 5-like [Zophobas morio]|uniref:ceramide synthase 5-like n=1 Tax=Zophobas morio TaxID=2755281 RepID=UPI003082B2FB